MQILTIPRCRNGVVGKTGKLRALGPDAPTAAIATHFKVVDLSESDNGGVHLECWDQGRAVSGSTGKAAL